MTKPTAIVLAGGRSSRLGQDKALLSLGQETLLQRTCRVAAECAAAVYVITPHTERYQTLVPMIGILQEQPLRGQSELYQGPLVGLLQALDYLAEQPTHTPWVLALACDLPNLSPRVLQTWWHGVSQQPPDALACLPRRQGRWEPLCGFYSMASRSSLQQYVGQGGRSFQGWLNQQAVMPLPLKDEAMLMNLNTPEDVQVWHQSQP